MSDTWKGRLWPALLVVGGACILFLENLAPRAEQHFVFLAQSFLQGKLDFAEMPGHWHDTSPYQGRYYWPLGPLPAVLLVPLVWMLGSSAQQGFLLFLFNLLSLFLLYRIALKLTGRASTSLWLSFAYVFATNYLFVGLVAWSWYFAQAVATSFMLWALHEFLYRRRWWIVGSALALAVATRGNLILAALFFGLFVLLDGGDWKSKVRSLASFACPVAVGLGLLLLYNYLRFETPFEFGYSLQLIDGAPAADRAVGLWSLMHFPANLYYLFLKGPEGVFIDGTKVLQFPFLRPNIWGMSIVFTSPIFLRIVNAPWSEKLVRLSGLTALAMLLFLLGYYGIGARQYGYRYALDFYPFLFVILCRSVRETLPPALKALVVASALFNLHLIPYTFGRAAIYD